MVQLMFVDSGKIHLCRCVLNCSCGRGAAVEVVAALASRISDAAAVASAAAMLLTIVEGSSSSGKLKVVFERSATLAAISALAAAPGSSETGIETAQDVVRRLCVICKTDNSDEVICPTVSPSLICLSIPPWLQEMMSFLSLSLRLLT